MFSDDQNLDSYPSFSMTNGMILQEAMREKNVNFTELFPILGPRSVVMEIIHGKRFLKPLQIKQLSELFGMGQEVFHVESSHDHGQIENVERGHELDKFSSSGYPDQDINTFSSQEEDLYDKSQINSFGEESSDKNQFDGWPTQSLRMR